MSKFIAQIGTSAAVTIASVHLGWGYGIVATVATILLWRMTSADIGEQVEASPARA